MFYLLKTNLLFHLEIRVFHSLYKDCSYCNYSQTLLMPLFIIGCPNNQRNTVKFFNFPLIHFIFEVPFYNSLIILLKKLLYIPRKHYSSCIPLVKPLIYCLTVFILRTPTLNINYIIRKISSLLFLW